MSMVLKPAPEFTADAVMPDGSVAPVSLNAFRDKKHVLLFFFPLAFTPVCHSELIAFDRMKTEFDSRDTQLLAISVDSVYTLGAWRNAAPGQGGIGPVSYPIVSDLSHAISENFGVLYNNAMALRGWFLIDRKGVIQHELVNAPPLGRSVAEALRMVDALRFYEQHGQICPADWHADQPGTKR